MKKVHSSKTAEFKTAEQQDLETKNLVVCIWAATDVERTFKLYSYRLIDQNEFIKTMRQHAEDILKTEV